MHPHKALHLSCCFTELGSGYRGVGRGRRVREEERERKERKQIHTTSEIEENCGGRGGGGVGGNQVPPNKLHAGRRRVAQQRLPTCTSPGEGNSPQPRERGIGAGMRLPNCCRLAAIGAMLAACAVRGTGAAVRGA